jgi:hypothetical protein
MALSKGLKVTGFKFLRIAIHYTSCILRKSEKEKMVSCDSKITKGTRLLCNVHFHLPEMRFRGHLKVKMNKQERQQKAKKHPQCDLKQQGTYMTLEPIGVATLFLAHLAVELELLEPF